MNQDPPALETLLRIYQKHLESMERKKEWLKTDAGKEYNRKKAKEYYEKNKEKVLEKRKKMYEEKGDIIRERNLEAYHKKKLNTAEA